MKTATREQVVAAITGADLLREGETRPRKGPAKKAGR
jgi:hypothetical protein